MVRMFKETAEQVLSALLYVWRTGEDPSYFQLRMADQWSRLNLDDPLHQGNQEVIDTMNTLHFRDPRPWDEVVKELCTSIRVADAGGEKDLIDSVADILQLPYARNFGPNTLRALRQAVLVPSELATLQSSLANRELICGRCERTLVEGEMATIAVDGRTGGGRVTGRVLLCVDCQAPSHMRCKTCRESTPTPSSFWKRLEKERVCDRCRDARKRGVDPLEAATAAREAREAGATEEAPRNIGIDPRQFSAQIRVGTTRTPTAASIRVQPSTRANQWISGAPVMAPPEARNPFRFDPEDNDDPR